MRGEQLLRGSGMAQRVELERKPYRRFGDPAWDPAKLGPIPTVEQEREARHEAFARLRSCGMGVGAAAAAIGLSASTGRWYERERLRRAGAA